MSRSRKPNKGLGQYRSVGRTPVRASRAMREAEDGPGGGGAPGAY